MNDNTTQEKMNKTMSHYPINSINVDEVPFNKENPSKHQMMMPSQQCKNLSVSNAFQSLSNKTFNTSFQDQHICKTCKYIRNATDTKEIIYEENKQQQCHPIQSMTIGYPAVSLLQRKMLQHKICYNLRPFMNMSQTIVKSYCQLVSVFELNWTLVEPLACCATHHHPIISAASISDSSFCSCTTVLKDTDHNYIQHQNVVSTPIENKRNYLLNLTDSERSLDVSIRTNRSQSMSYDIKEGQCQISSRIKTKHQLKERRQSASQKIYSLLSDQHTSNKFLCGSPVHRHYAIFPFLLESRRCCIKWDSKKLKSDDVLSTVSTSVTTDHTVTSESSKKNKVGADPIFPLSIFESRVRNKSKIIKNTSSQFLEKKMIRAYSEPERLFHESTPKIKRKNLSSTESILEPQMINQNITVISNRNFFLKSTNNFNKPHINQTKRFNDKLYLNHSNLTNYNGIDEKLIIGDQQLIKNYKCLSDHSLSFSNSSVSSDLSDGEPQSSSEFSDQSDEMFSLDSKHFVLEQLRCLGLHGCQYPDDFIVVFLTLPAHVLYHFRTNATFRRPLSLQCFSVDDARTVHSYFYNETEKKWKKTLANHKSELSNNRYDFTRLVRTKKDGFPLLIRSRPVVSDGYLQSTPQSSELYAELQHSPSKNPVVDQQKVCLFVFCSGKDMVSFDWLPFISRFYNFIITETCKQSRRSHTIKDSVLSKTTCTDLRHTSSKSTVKNPEFSCPLRPLIPLQKDIIASLCGPTLTHNDCITGNTEINHGDPFIYSNFGVFSCSVRAGIIMLEYPGSGQSCGPPSVEAIVDSAVQCIGEAIQELSSRMAPSVIELRFFGYSLGAAVALELSRIIANDIVIQHEASDNKSVIDSYSGPLVTKSIPFQSIAEPPKLTLGPLLLVAPFTSVVDWATCFLRIPQMLHRWTEPILSSILGAAGVLWDNVSSIKELASLINSNCLIFNDFKICIVHGTRDRVIPVWMGRRLAAEAKKFLLQNNVSLHQNPETTGRHLNLTHQASLPCEEFQCLIVDGTSDPVDHDKKTISNEKCLNESNNMVELSQQHMSGYQGQLSSSRFLKRDDVENTVSSCGIKHKDTIQDKKICMEKVCVQNTKAKKKLNKPQNNSKNQEVLVEMLEMAGDHHTILKDLSMQETIFRRLYSPWIVQKTKYT